MATCTLELEHLDKLAESLLPGMRQRETISGRAGLQSGDSWIFLAVGLPTSYCICWPTRNKHGSRANRKAEEEEHAQLFSAPHPSHPQPKSGRLRTVAEASPGNRALQQRWLEAHGPLRHE